MSDIRALIIDDEFELISTLVERLEIRGIDATGVQTGAAALEKIAQQPFDVVVLDIKLKGESGVDVMKRIKEVRFDIPVLLLTGHMSKDTCDECMQAGAIDYIIKPIDIEDLIGKMREAIKVYSAGQGGMR